MARNTNATPNSELNFNPSGLRVLLVDSKLPSRQHVRGLLQSCGYQVTSCRTGRECVQLLSNTSVRREDTTSPLPMFPFDLILKDHEPPLVDACRLLRKMSRDPTLAAVPVVVMSRSDDRDMVIKCLQLGAVDYLIKPLRRNELQNIWTRVWWRRLLSDVVPPDTNMPASGMAYSSDSKETYCVEDTDPVSKEGSAPAGTGNNHNSRDQLDVKTHHGSNNGNGSNRGSKNGHRGGSNGNGCSTSRNAVAGSGNAPALNAAAAYDPPTNNNGHGSNEGGVEGGGSGGDGGSGDNANVGNSGNNGTGNSTVQSQQKGELPGVADLSEVPTSRAPVLAKGDQIAQGDYRPAQGEYRPKGPSPNGQVSGSKRGCPQDVATNNMQHKIPRLLHGGLEHNATPGAGVAVAVGVDIGDATPNQQAPATAAAPPASTAMHGAVPLYSWPSAVQSGAGGVKQGSGGISPTAQPQHPGPSEAAAAAAAAAAQRGGQFIMFRPPLLQPMWQGWDQQRMADHQQWLRSLMPPTHGGRFASTSGDPASHLSDSTAAHAAAVVQMHEQQQRAQMQQGHYAGAYPYAAFVQYNMAAAANMASMGMWPWTGAAYPGATTDSTKAAVDTPRHNITAKHSDTKHSSHTAAADVVIPPDHHHHHHHQPPRPQNVPISPAKERRAQALTKYKEKRRNLKFGKKIRYETRKALADSRPRVKGQFVKAGTTATTPTQTNTTNNNTEPGESNEQQQQQHGGVPHVPTHRGHSRLRPHAASAQDAQDAVEVLAAMQSNSPVGSSERVRSAVTAVGGRTQRHGSVDNGVEAADAEEQEGPYEDHADTRVPVEGGDEVVVTTTPARKLARSVQGSVVAPGYCGDSNEGGKSQGSNGRRNGSDSGSNSPDRGE